MNGYMGKILRVDLTTRRTSTINTADYEPWVGGHGIGSAIFWDLCKDKTISGLDPRNVVTIMTSPLSGTLAPGVSGRTEVQGIGPQLYPYEWFTRSNFGGRFAGMLKWAGWDGVVLEGRADSPVWLDIRNDDVAIRDASKLWGLDSWETQEEIWRDVGGSGVGSDWWEAADGALTTQRPAVLAIGQAGETLSRTAALIHDAGNGAGQGGFGAVWGAKNLKAVSVIGTGSVSIADPKALMDGRLWAKRNYGVRLEDLRDNSGSNWGRVGYASSFPPGTRTRPQGCQGCIQGCRGRTETGLGNESHCADFLWYSSYNSLAGGGKVNDDLTKSVDLMQRLGVNAFDLTAMLGWLTKLYKKGLVGPGKAIDTDLPFDKIGTLEFADEFLRQIVAGEGLGKYLHEGCARAAVELGRWDEDTRTGDLALRIWGFANHYDARTEVEWGYGDLVGDRDINEHDFNQLIRYATNAVNLQKQGKAPRAGAAEVAAIMGEKLRPYCDPMMIDYSDQGIYSDAMAKLVAWHRHYTRFWKQSVLYCDWAFANFFNPYQPDFKGITPLAEPRFFNAVTGRNWTFEDGMEAGRKIFNLDKAVMVVQGRHRDQEVFTDYHFEVTSDPNGVPVFENGQWQFKAMARKLDRMKVEEWKTKYYKLEGWEESTGWPTRETLEGLGMEEIADTLESAGKLGK